MLYSDSELLGEGLRRYYEANNLPPDGGKKDPWARYQFGPLHAIAFPNFSLRDEALRRHDIHHVLSNLDTSPRGEGMIAAWELGSGCGRYWISWFMESQALWWGILLAYRETLGLFCLGRHSNNYFHLELGENIEKQAIGDLRKKVLPEKREMSLGIIDLALFLLTAIFGLFCLTVFVPVATFFTVFGFIIGESRISLSGG